VVFKFRKHKMQDYLIVVMAFPMSRHLIYVMFCNQLILRFLDGFNGYPHVTLFDIYVMLCNQLGLIVHFIKQK